MPTSSRYISICFGFCSFCLSRCVFSYLLSAVTILDQSDYQDAMKMFVEEGCCGTSEIICITVINQCEWEPILGTASLHG